MTVFGRKIYLLTYDRQPLPEALEERHEQGRPHGCPHRRARSASLLTCSSTLETPPSATRYANGLGTMSSASDALAKVANSRLSI